jgi:hypothetical protein
MSNKKAIISSLATVVAAGAIGVNVANAHIGISSAKREALRHALENNDFAAFHEAIKDLSQFSAIDTEVEFQAIVEAYELRQNGHYAKAQAVLESAGIERPFLGTNTVQPSVRSALGNTDWDEFRAATEGKKIARTINAEERFFMLVEAQTLHKEGRHEEAREIMRELGLYGDYI